MFDLDKWKEIWAVLSRNKLRTFLTALGVFWGVFMLVVMIGAGYGFEKGIFGQIDGVATNTAFMWSQNTTKAYSGFKKGRSWNIERGDIDIISEKIDGIKYITPRIGLYKKFSDGMNVYYKDKKGNFRINGDFPVYSKMDAFKILEGRFLNDFDISKDRKVCVIGKTVAKDLFGKKESPIGKYINIVGVYFKVIGIVDAVSQINIGGRKDKSVYVPFTTLQLAYNMGVDVHFFLVTGKEGVDIAKLSKNVSAILKKRHKIDPTDESAVGSFNLQKEIKKFSNLMNGVKFLIWIVGIGTLLAGAIGISNIMLVVVKERTQEIGIRRALGARTHQISSQLILESATITAIAGIAGIVFGTLVLAGASMVLAQNPDSAFISNMVIQFDLAIYSLLIIVIIGVLAGIIPAQKALSIKPIEALRTE
ncbi:ABC transporter permease [Halosquirtibacter xylanolyticus]|uniref:ABC transporter permease n=1 Tax=Halosquirtibacter xylanolyticus TaxID=3374599 RepID=UPI00374982F0|nr:ABC transporter permease [Prolixibacteraceae bacterium]